MKIDNTKLYVSKSHIAGDNSRNLGVFAAKNFDQGEIVEVCPVIMLDEESTKLILNTELKFYRFVYGDSDHTSCIALGYGSLYNHSLENANIHWNEDLENKTIVFYALKSINKDQELLFNYNGLDSKEQVTDFGF